MHFVTGGSYNGKRKWVTAQYILANSDNVTWLSGGNWNPHDDLSSFKKEHLIINEMEYVIKKIGSRERFCKLLDLWINWEQKDKRRKLILIGSDICKGIVPLKKEERHWRDLTGWCYQEIAAKATKVDIIWYGIAQSVKLV